MSLDAADREVLGGIAREALRAAVVGHRFAPIDPERLALEERCGCFVTLKTAGRLRGCLGCFTSERPLWKTVAEYARLSALDDPRFADDRLTPVELLRVEMEISVLSPLRKCVEPGAIVLGRDGIYINSHGHGGCFLPQVATEMKWDVEEFWGHCCRDKARLAWDAWRRPDAECYTFTTEVIEV